jgi:cytoskeletal protein CcmA (bactofilin family)
MLSKKPAADERLSASPMSGSTFSVFGPDVAFKGDLTASADLHIDGKVEGDISCASLVQGEASEIIGMVAADSARIAGKVKGSISAGSLVVQKSARIEGDLTYDSIVIEQGARVDGKLSFRVAEPVLTLAGGTQANGAQAGAAQAGGIKLV